MPKVRKTYAPSLKAKVAIEAIKGQRTTSEISKIFGVHPNLIGMWKRQALEGLPEVFERGRDQQPSPSGFDADMLYRQIGVLQVELEFLKKKSGLVG